MKKNNKKDLLWIYRAMKTSRYFEERMEKAYLEGIYSNITDLLVGIAND